MTEDAPSFEPYGYSGYCAHVTVSAYTNWIFCELVENNSRNGYAICQHLRETGRCLHP